MKYISVKVRNALIMHGYTDDNKEIVEEVSGEPFVEKLLLVDRIQSVSEKYILVSSSHGRVLYWEYQDGFEALKARLAAANLLIA